MISGFREDGKENFLDTAGNSWARLANGGRFDLDPEVSFDDGAVTLFVLWWAGISRTVEQNAMREGTGVAAHGNGN